jgi:cell division initiation protein
MPYTPVELRHVKLGRALFGFKRDETERLLTDVADSFEDVWRERGELTDKVHELDHHLEEIRTREALLSATLVAAEKSAVESKDAARREAELIIAEAHGEARSIMRAAQSERERLFAEVRRVESLLRSALGIVVESRGEPPPGRAAVEPAAAESGTASSLSGTSQAEDEPGAPDPVLPPAAAAPRVPVLPPAPEHWPKREDTREFAVVQTDDPAPDPLSQNDVPSLPEMPEASVREFAWGD